MRSFTVFFLFFSLFFYCCELFPESKPAWTSQVHYVEGDTHYFVGRASEQPKGEDGVDRALANALSIVSKYIRAEVKSLLKTYEEAVNDSSETVIHDVFTERGAEIVVKNYIRESYFEKYMSGGHTYFETYVKIAVPQHDIALMEIKAAGANAWNFKASGCDGGQSEEIEAVFKEAASRLGWKLEPDQSEKPGFSQSFPRTAYFISVRAKCSGTVTVVAVERYDMVEKLLVTSAYSKADSPEKLKNELFNSLQIYVPMIDFPEYPDTKNSSFLDGTSPELKNLYADAVKAEEKGRLVPQKAENLWKEIAGVGGKNPLRPLAQNRIDFYKKMAYSRSQLAANEPKEFENLKKMAKSSDVAVYSKAVAGYLDLYGAWAGSEKLKQLVDFAGDEKKADVRKAVFSGPKFFSWESACQHGNPAKCYLVSMKDDGNSVALKKYACEYRVEQACFDLYSYAKDGNRGNDAAVFAEKSCYLGNRNSCLAAATILYTGKMKAAKNFEKSLSLLEDSCEAESGESCYMLGVIYDDGNKSIRKDKNKAKEFYKKSCGFGFKKSCRY